jgi:hypothetical protein
MPDRNSIEVRLQQTASLPHTLAAGFDAFEAIRAVARGYQDQTPALFPAFMSAADAAVDGREALTAAPSLPPGDVEAGHVVPDDVHPAQAIDRLAALAAVLRSRLTQAAGAAEATADREACQDAAAAASRICDLLARGEP